MGIGIGVSNRPTCLQCYSENCHHVQARLQMMGMGAQQDQYNSMILGLMAQAQSGIAPGVITSGDWGKEVTTIPNKKLLLLRK